MKTFKLSEIQSDIKNQVVASCNFEALLSYFMDDGSQKISGNINTGINIEIDNPSLLKQFHVSTDMYWPQISQKIYGTDSLYWFLQLLNPYATKSPYDKVKAPFHIFYLPSAERIIRNA